MLINIFLGICLLMFYLGFGFIFAMFGFTQWLLRQACNPDHDTKIESASVLFWIIIIPVAITIMITKLVIIIAQKTIFFLKEKRWKKWYQSWQEYVSLFEH